MNKDVLVSIKGLQFDEAGGDGEIETVTPGQYYKKNGNHYLLYEEAMEGFTELTHNKIKWTDHSLDLTKKGVVNVHMVFEENQKNMTDYQTPFGNILIGIDTKKISVDESQENIRVNVNYALEINYEHLADCSITMDIRNKDYSNPS